jgi:hypothetical protein
MVRQMHAQAFLPADGAVTIRHRRPFAPRSQPCLGQPFAGRGVKIVPDVRHRCESKKHHSPASLAGRIKHCRRKIDPAPRDRLADGTPNDNDRVEIGPTQLAFREWAAAGLTPPEPGRMREFRWKRLTQALVDRDIGGLLMFDPLNIRYATDTTNMQLWNSHNPFRACPSVRRRPHGDLGIQELALPRDLQPAGGRAALGRVVLLQRPPATGGRGRRASLPIRSTR